MSMAENEQQHGTQAIRTSDGKIIIGRLPPLPQGISMKTHFIGVDRTGAVFALKRHGQGWAVGRKAKAKLKQERLMRAVEKLKKQELLAQAREYRKQINAQIEQLKMRKMEIKGQI